MTRIARTLPTAACAVAVVAAAARAQTPQPTPRLAFHLPPADSVRVLRDQPYKQGPAAPLRYDLYLPPRTSSRALPIVVVFNGGRGDSRGVSLNVGWARLFGGAGLAAVTYESDTSGAEKNFDALVQALRRDGHGVDAARMALWAGSSNVSAALPIASDTARRFIRSAAMYYGTARIASFRSDLPVQLVRVGLDQPALQYAQDSLIARAIAANAPIEILNHPSGEHPFEESVTRANKRVVESTVAFLFHTLAADFDGALSEQAVRAEAGAASYNGDWARAARAFAALASSAPNDFEVQRKLADARLAAGDAAGAILAYLRSRELGHWRKGDIAIGLIAAYAQAGRREEAYAEIAALPPQWSKAGILANSPQLAAFRSDPEFVRRMR